MLDFNLTQQRPREDWLREDENMRRRVCGGQEVCVWTHCEADAHGGSEGSWEELALVELNQQGGLAHAAVPHEDGLQRDATSGFPR